MSALRAWFDARSLRERRLILVMLALLAVTFVWLLVIVPVQDGLSSARTRYADAVIRLGQAEADARAVRGIQRRQPAPVPLPLADAIRTRAAEANLSLVTLDAQGDDRVRISVTGASAGAITAWLARLEGEGILVQDLTITAAGGTVTANATLAARAS